MHIGRIILYSVLLDVLFYIAYSARYGLFVLMCRKTHITHSLTVILLRNFGAASPEKYHMRRGESAQRVLTFRTRSQAADTTLSVMHCIAVKSVLK